MKENHRLFLEELMRYDRQQHLGVAPYERGQRRADQANGFYQRTLATRADGTGGTAQPLGSVSTPNLAALPTARGGGG